jgi:integrase
MNDYKINEWSMHPVCRVVVQISLLFFCRVSEVLSLTTKNIIEPDRVLCVGAKRGHSYIIFLPGLSKQVSNIENQGAPVLLFPVSYIKCYRSCIRAGLRLDLPGAANKKVTHAGRYLVKELASAGFTDRQLSDVLHHRSSSSLSYYLT